MAKHPRTLKIQIWASETEKARWELQASNQDLTLAEWSRRAMDKALAQELSIEVQAITGPGRAFR
jgi:hypothetical protein